MQNSPPILMIWMIFRGATREPPERLWAPPVSKTPLGPLFHCFDENLNIVPTLQEAYDFIDMEEIERQLEL